MVFTKDRHPHKWTLKEQKKLLELWKSEKDWDERSKKMYEAFPTRKYKGFFSPSVCNFHYSIFAVFRRAIQSLTKLYTARLRHRSRLMKNQAATALKHWSISGLIISRKKWVLFSTFIQICQITKEHEQHEELCMVEIRNCYALIDRIISGEPKMSDDQILSYLEEAREHDAKVCFYRKKDKIFQQDPSTNIVVNAYMRRLIAQEEERKKTEAEAVIGIFSYSNNFRI